MAAVDKAGLSISVDASEVMRRLPMERQKIILRCRSWMVKHGNDVRNSAKENLRWKSAAGAPGGHASGRLRQSLNWGMVETAAEMSGRVAAGVPYGRYVEGWNKAGEKKPVEKHYVPFTTAPGLRIWLERHGVSVPKSAQGWVVGGPDAVSPFLEPAFKKHEPGAMRSLRRILR
jgi:hypothetical protein